jgi:hypothetical protein
MAALIPLQRSLLPKLSPHSVQSSLLRTASTITTPSFQRRQQPRQPGTSSILLAQQARRSIGGHDENCIRRSNLRRSFHASPPRRRDHHFDTLKFVQRLQSEGFTEEQSVAMMKVLNDVIEERCVFRVFISARMWRPSDSMPHSASRT